MNLLAICCFLCHHSLLMLIVSHASYFSCKNQSVCMFTLIFSFFFCVGTWLFFNQLIIIVLCSFDSRQFPEINEKKKKPVLPQTWRVMHCGLLPVSSSARWERLWQTEAIDSEDDSPDRTRSSIFNHLHEFFYSPQSGVISIQMKSGAKLLVAAIYL